VRITKFRIRHYKSIIDSGYCLLASDITILAGKNESGKSAILEALRDFAPSVTSLPGDATPVDNSGTPEVEVHLQLSNDELDQDMRLECCTSLGALKC